MNRTALLVVVFGVLAGACASAGTEDGAASNEAAASAGATALPLIGGDASWIACDDGTMAITAYDRRGSDGESRPLTVSLLMGRLALAGTSPDALEGAPNGGDAIPYAIDLKDETGEAKRLQGNLAIDYPKQEAHLTGTLVEASGTTKVDRTLHCRGLGRDFEAGAMVPNPAPAGDSASLICESAKVVASIFERRNETGDGRDTSLTLVLDGAAVVSGSVPESSSAVQLSSQSSSNTFAGTAVIDYANDKLKIRGTINEPGLGKWTIDEVVDCTRIAPSL